MSKTISVQKEHLSLLARRMERYFLQVAGRLVDHVLGLVFVQLCAVC